MTKFTEQLVTAVCRCTRIYLSLDASMLPPLLFLLLLLLLSASALSFLFVCTALIFSLSLSVSSLSYCSVLGAHQTIISIKNRRESFRHFPHTEKWVSVFLAVAMA